MNYLNTCFYDKYDGHFYEYLSHVDFEFDKLIPEYGALSDQEERLLDKFPTLRKVVDDREENILSIDEVKALIDYHQCYENRETMQDKKLIYAGFRCAYVVFKNAELLREDISLDDILQY